MRVIIDRIEGLYAICEMDNRKMIEVELKNIPKQAKEGDVLDIEGSFIIINKAETEKRRIEIEELTNNK